MLGWRDTPVNGDAIGREARASQPYIEQFFVGRPEGLDEDAFERLLYRVRRRTENEIAASDIEDKDDLLHPLVLLSHHHLQGPDAGPAD